MPVTNRFAAMCETVQSPEHQDGELLAGIAAMRKQASAAAVQLEAVVKLAEGSPDYSQTYENYRAAQQVDPSMWHRSVRMMMNPGDSAASMIPTFLGGSTNAQMKVTGYDANQNPRYGSTPYGQALLNMTGKQMQTLGSDVASGEIDPAAAGTRMQQLKAGINPGNNLVPLTNQQRQLQMRSATPGNAIKRPDVTPGKPAAKFRPVAISKPTDAF